MKALRNCSYSHIWHIWDKKLSRILKPLYSIPLIVLAISQSTIWYLAFSVSRGFRLCMSLHGEFWWKCFTQHSDRICSLRKVPLKVPCLHPFCYLHSHPYFARPTSFQHLSCRISGVAFSYLSYLIHNDPTKKRTNSDFTVTFNLERKRS